MASGRPHPWDGPRPQGATLWSARLAGRPIRPGIAGGDAVLLPLEKGRVGEEAPTFAVELIYLQRSPTWTDKGSATLTLPALDLPVSRTGVTLHYSPRFKVEVQPGAFRLAGDIGPVAEALRPPPPPPARPTAAPTAAPASAGLQALVDRFQNGTAGGGVVGPLPVSVTFPLFGRSLFLASELLQEGAFPSVDFTFKRAK